ncbi:splicing factor C9orf78-like isoform X1 [Mya arenaria]|uniref:splicing factor C9orf78-like isoform X1 n=1 Tax=Mya arenaria TaxID=6604 RepID=UPI0022DF4EB7|nr:splicing factor C9orf78-like isoform X1 [Mya arenaria]
MAEFKKSKKKNFRKRRNSSDSDIGSDPEIETSTKLGDIKELQKTRERQKGVDIVGLALGKKIPKTEERDSHDPFKMQTGGYIDMKALKSSGTQLTEEEKEAIGTAFAAETNKRDEDAEMQKFVEEELKRRKGHVTEDGLRPGQSNVSGNKLFELPDQLKSITSRFKKSEDMLSSQMLSGIPEIDLGIDAKIRNIEETEEAKQRLIEERRRKKDKISEFVPTNMAVNFVQHNRFTIEDAKPASKKEEPVPAKKAKVGEADRPGQAYVAQWIQHWTAILATLVGTRSPTRFFFPL